MYMYVSVSSLETDEGSKIYDEAVQRLEIATRKGAPVKIAQRESTGKNRKITACHLFPSIKERNKERK